MKKLGEDGFAPIIVSIIIVIVLSLLTLGFVTLANNSAKNALNRQLSNNAYYAADSGINDAIQAIASGSYTQAKNTCGPIAGNPYLGNNQINGPQDYYSCLLINPNPSTLQYSSVSSNQPVATLISTVNTNNPPTATNPAYFIFSWEPSANVEASPYSFAPSSYYPGCTLSANIYGACLPTAVNWTNFGKPITGILRLSLTPLRDRGPLPSDTSGTYTAFLYPQSGSGSVNTAPSFSTNTTIGANSGVEVSGNCNNSSVQPEACTVEIPVSSANTNGFIMSLRSLYTNSRVTVEAYDNTGSQLLFRNGQTLIDSTGNDHGVKRRIQVRISSLNYNGFPAYDIASSNTICKDLQAYPANSATGTVGNAISICGL